MQPMRQVLLMGYITEKRMAWDKLTKKRKEHKLLLCYMFANDDDDDDDVGDVSWIVNWQHARLRRSIVFFARVVVPYVWLVFFIAKSYDSWKWDTAYHQMTI